MAEQPEPGAPGAGEPLEAVAPPPAKRGAGKVVAAVIVAALVAGGLAAYWFFMRGPEYPWLFEGAYAEYEGQMFVLFFPVDMKIRLEVVDFNDTHATLNMKLTVSLFGESSSEENTTYIELKTGTIMLGDLRPNSTYETTIEVKGLGERKCIVQVFEDEGGKIEFYMDKEYMWPLKIVIDTGDSDLPLEVELELKSTNIEELKPKD